VQGHRQHIGRPDLTPDLASRRMFASTPAEFYQVGVAQSDCIPNCDPYTSVELISTTCSLYGSPSGKIVTGDCSRPDRPTPI
jgi:hypothetical protein